MKSQDLKAVGYGFRPTDVELINHYLKNKMIGNEAQVEAIPEVDFLKFEPWDLPDRSVIELRDNEWYFFFEISSINGSRSKRATKLGFWKKTGKDREIKAPGSKETIGIKKTLVFHLGRVPNGVGTNWVIHEYHLLRTFPSQSELVLIKLKRNVDKVKDKEMNSPSNEVEHRNDFGVTYYLTTEINTTPEVQRHGEASFESTLTHPIVDSTSPGYSNGIDMDQSQYGDKEQLAADDDFNMLFDPFVVDELGLGQEMLEHNVATKIDARLQAQGNGKEAISNYTLPGFSNGINMDPSRSGDNEQQLPEDDSTKFFSSSQDRDNEKLANNDLSLMNIGYEVHAISNFDYFSNLDNLLSLDDLGDGGGQEEAALALPPPVNSCYPTIGSFQ